MITLVSFITRNPALSFDAFRTHWIEVHAPLVRAGLPAMRGYRAHFEGGTREGYALLDCDAIVELSFDSVDAMHAAMASAAFNTPERIASSARLMGTATPRNMVLDTREA